MQIAATHTNTDFDALASLVAATYLYPAATGVLPTKLRRNVRQFLALHRDLFKICSIRELDLEEVTGLIVVDTNHWDRLEQLGTLRQQDDLAVVLWDHHLQGTNIEASWKCQEPAGSTITLMLREMKSRDCVFPPMHATLFLMGIYEDTGSLGYPSTTADDAHAAGYLLENGADLNVATSYLSQAFDDGHTEVLAKMLDSSPPVTLAGYEVGVLLVPIDSSLSMLSSVVSRYKDIKGLDAAIGVFATCSDRCLVIGCAAAQEIDIGEIMRKLGGGGHAGAGSAMVKSEAAEAVRDKVMALITGQLSKPRTWVRHIMSQPEALVPPTTPIREVRSMVEGARSRTVLVLDDGKFSGMVSKEECRKARTDIQLKAPVKAFMRTQVPLLHPDDPPREALRLMTEAETAILPVVEDGSLIGIVTRADLVLHLYEF